MASQYTGDPTATQAPSPTPGMGVYPIGNLPVDGDTLNASAFAQAYKVCLDYIAFLQSKMIFGIPPWDATTSYHSLSIVAWRTSDGGTGYVYRVKSGHSPDAGTLPNDTTHWERWGWSKTELEAAMTVAIQAYVSSEDVSASISIDAPTSGTVGTAVLATIATQKRLTMHIYNIPYDASSFEVHVAGDARVDAPLVIWSAGTNANTTLNQSENGETSGGPSTNSFYSQCGMTAGTSEYDVYSVVLHNIATGHSGWITIELVGT